MITLRTTTGVFSTWTRSIITPKRWSQASNWSSIAWYAQRNRWTVARADSFASAPNVHANLVWWDKRGAHSEHHDQRDQEDFAKHPQAASHYTVLCDFLYKSFLAKQSRRLPSLRRGKRVRSKRCTGSIGRFTPAVSDLLQSNELLVSMPVHTSDSFDSQRNRGNLSVLFSVLLAAADWEVFGRANQWNVFGVCDLGSPIWNDFRIAAEERWTVGFQPDSLSGGIRFLFVFDFGWEERRSEQKRWVLSKRASYNHILFDSE